MTSPAENRDAHTALVEQLRENWPPPRWVARNAPAPATSTAANCCPATESTVCSTPAVRSGNRAAGRRRHVRRRMPRRRHHHWHRPDIRSRMHDRGQRRDGQRRYLLPDYGQEAPARSGDRGPEPAAVHLSGRLRRRLPAPSGRGFPDRDHFGRIFYNQASLGSRASRRSRRCSDRAPPAAHTSRR